MYCGFVGEFNCLEIFLFFIFIKVEILLFCMNLFMEILESVLRNLMYLMILNFRFNKLCDLLVIVFCDLVSFKFFNVGFNKLLLLLGCLF